MTRFWQGKLKRKDLEEVYDDFAEFSLSSPARKIRRLDADLPPILEQSEPTFTSTSACNQPFQNEESSTSSSDVPKFETTGNVAMHMRSFDNEERALVLYKPVEMPLMFSPEPTCFSLQINSSFMDGLNHVFKPRNLDYNNEQLRGAQDNCLAVIPWIPSQVSSSGGTEIYMSGSQLSQEGKEAEDNEVAFMEIEEDRQQGTSGGLGSEGFHQQQHQHCWNAQLPPDSSNSVTWSL